MHFTLQGSEASAVCLQGEGAMASAVARGRRRWRLRGQWGGQLRSGSTGSGAAALGEGRGAREHVEATVAPWNHRAATIL
jgi:hypothetical protein